MDFSQIRIPEASPPGGAHLQELIGDPTCGQMSQTDLTSGNLLKEDMEKRLMIARLVPKLPDMTKDHNIYRGKVEIHKFAEDLQNNAGVVWDQLETGCINIALSTLIPISETYSNEYGQSELLSGMSGMLSGGMMGEIAFATNTRSFGDTKFVNTKEVDEKGNPIKKEVWEENSLMRGIESLGGFGKTAADAAMKAKQVGGAMLDKMQNSKNSVIKGLGKLGSAFAHIANNPWSKVDWPLFWKNCSFQQQYECTTRLWCYNTHDDQMYANYILAPIAALLMFVTPKSDDGWLYEWPYMTSFDIIGSIHMPLAYISNLTIIKGGDVGDFSLSGRPNIVDLRFTVSSLYSVCVNAPIDVEGQNMDRPAVSKQMRALNSYMHWGKKISPNLNGPDKAAEPKLPANIPTNAAQMHKAAEDAAAEYEKYRKRIGGSDKLAKTAADFMYTAYGRNGVSESKRALEEAMKQNKEKSEQDAANAKDAAQSERTEKTEGGGDNNQQPGNNQEQTQTPQQPDNTQQTPQQSEEDKKKAEEESKKKSEAQKQAQDQKAAFEGRF